MEKTILRAEARGCVTDNGIEVREARPDETPEFFGVYLRGNDIGLHIFDFEDKIQAQKLADRINWVVPRL